MHEKIYEEDARRLLVHRASIVKSHPGGDATSNGSDVKRELRYIHEAFRKTGHDALVNYISCKGHQFLVRGKESIGLRFYVISKLFIVAVETNLLNGCLRLKDIRGYGMTVDSVECLMIMTGAWCVRPSHANRILGRQSSTVHCKNRSQFL